MSLITCPECESVFTEQQFKDAGMCPSCGLPESVIRRHMPEPAPEKTGAKNKAMPGPNDPDAPYKTTASKLLAAFAWLIWAGGAIGVIVIAIAASQLRYSFYGSNSAGTVLFFAALAVASSSLFFGALLYGASKLLIDIHAARLNLEQLNAKKED
jgi:hypothetical protein|nr:MAG TPA_asm: Rubredoxin loop, ELECTRON TRANSPORT [Caudoviricetes sp.]